MVSMDRVDAEALASTIQKNRSRGRRWGVFVRHVNAADCLTQSEVLEGDGPVASAEQSDESQEYDQRRQHA
jgi:hypothetical protein